MRRLCYILLLAVLTLGGASAETIGDYVFPSLEASKTEVYVGEPFEISLTIRSHTVTLDQDFLMNPFKNPAIKQLPRDTGMYPVERRVVNNRIEEIRKFSWKAVGVATGAVDLANTIEFSVLSRNTRLFFSSPKRTPFSLPVKGAIIDIKPLPADGRPEGFSGAVGRFSLSVDVTPKAAAPGDVLRIRSEVRGSGLLENIGPPLLTSVDGLKVYDPRRLPDESALVFEQQVVPQSTAALKVPELTFSYFDPDREAYETLRAGPFQIAFRERAASDVEAFRPEGDTASQDTRDRGSRPTHLTIALAFCALFVFAAAIVILRRSQSRFAILIVCAVILIAVTAFAFALLRIPSQAGKNMFQMESHQIGGIAPSASSPRTLAIPSGAHVEVITCQEGWAMVAYNGRHCWIPESNLGPIGKSSGK